MGRIPVVPLPGSDQWAHAWDWGSKLAEVFPDQDATDFAICCDYNDAGNTTDRRILSLVMLTQGENDGGPWVWAVEFETNGYDPDWWVMIGGCDYTGWDCQSYNVWTEVKVR